MGMAVAYTVAPMTSPNPVPSQEAVMLTPGEKLIEEWRTRATKAWISDPPLVVSLGGGLCFPETQSLADAVGAALLAERERTQTALREIVNLAERPFEKFPADWQEQIASCDECQRYKDHPIQRGICDEHRRPLWDREKHDAFERAALGPRMREIAIRTLAQPETKGGKP